MSMDLQALQSQIAIKWKQLHPYVMTPASITRDTADNWEAFNVERDVRHIVTSQIKRQIAGTDSTENNAAYDMLKKFIGQGISSMNARQKSQLPSSLSGLIDEIEGAIKSYNASSKEANIYRAALAYLEDIIGNKRGK